MAPKNTRAFAHYLIFVGLPFLSVLGLIQLGENLTAQPSVAGRWELDATFEANKDTPCAVSLSGFHSNVIEITQSGKYLELTIPNRSRDRMRGTIHSPRLLVEARPALFGDDVFDLIRISGTFDRDEEMPVLHGLLSMPRRIDCSPVPFRAQRTETPRFAWRHH